MIDEGSQCIKYKSKWPHPMNDSLTALSLGFLPAMWSHPVSLDPVKKSKIWYLKGWYEEVNILEHWGSQCFRLLYFPTNLNYCLQQYYLQIRMNRPIVIGKLSTADRMIILRWLGHYVAISRSLCCYDMINIALFMNICISVLIYITQGSFQNIGKLLHTLY